MHFNENQGDIVLVASVDGVPAGVATDMATGGALSIWIVAEYRRLGIEDALLHAIETVYRLNGHVKAEAPVNVPKWLSELLHRNGYLYEGGDELG